MMKMKQMVCNYKILVIADEKKCKMEYQKSIYKPSLVNALYCISVYNPSKTQSRVTQSFNIVNKRKVKLVNFYEH